MPERDGGGVHPNIGPHSLHGRSGVDAWPGPPSDRIPVQHYGLFGWSPAPIARLLLELPETGRAGAIFALFAVLRPREVGPPLGLGDRIRLST